MLKKLAPSPETEPERQKHQDVVEAIEAYFGVIRECDELRAINAALGHELASMRAVNEELRRGTMTLLRIVDAKTKLLHEANIHLGDLYLRGKHVAKSTDAVSATTDEETRSIANLCAPALTPMSAAPHYTVTGPRNVGGIAPNITHLAAARGEPAAAAAE